MEYKYITLEIKPILEFIRLLKEGQPEAAYNILKELEPAFKLRESIYRARQKQGID